MFELPPEWKPLLKSEYGESGHEVQLYSSQRGLVMLVPEKRNGSVIGAACVACKPLAIEGSEASLRSLRVPGEMTIVKKLNSATSHLLVFSQPFHFTSRDSLPSLLDGQLKQLEKVQYTLARLDGMVVGEAKPDELFSDPSLSLASWETPKIESIS